MLSFKTFSISYIFILLFTTFLLFIGYIDSYRTSVRIEIASPIYGIGILCVLFAVTSLQFVGIRKMDIATGDELSQMTIVGAEMKVSQLD